MKSAGVMTYRFGVLESLGVSEGQTDPVTGFIPMDKSGVAYGDIVSIAVWRKPDWVAFVIALLVPVPIALLSLVGALETPFFAVTALLFGSLGGWMIYLAMFFQRAYARVIGRYRTIEIRFDRPIWKRTRFHDELLRRAGIGPRPLP